MSSALLVMDVQRAIVDIADTDPGSGYLPRLRRAIDGARAANIPVIYVVIALRPGFPEVGTRNRALAAIARDGLFVEGAPGTEIHPEIAPQPGEVVVTKKRASAFSGSDLDVVLRARGIDSLVLTGIATSAVVLYTLCQANDLDFGLTVLSDACLDTDPETHRVVVERLFPQWADVVAVDDWLKTIAPQ
ncbi:isochorismatase family protein [Streptomyces broussonetiae]|uniref:Isochorismatase family protein n=1 Tax=Streptomyces broussonetiae TaxID=2686304 RepID=A0A6I6MW87_9ACTN|nr:cysteine hydrolase [Streptomyces broussonetiae]QHA02519.1 isochorismatase family protein [Streptomyces broussonetiae]